AGGVRFTNAHAMPICTPTRVQLMTGQYNFRNYKRFGEMSAGEITFGNLLRDAGYTTCIAGKWQLGGNHDSIRAFGFDTYCLWNFMGRGAQYWGSEIWENGKKRNDIADRFGPDIHVDHLLKFLDLQTKDKPFLAYWTTPLPHEPYGPTPDSPDAPKPGTIKPAPGQGESHDYGDPKYFPEMLTYMDMLIGKVVQRLEDLKLRENTIIVFVGDNGTGYKVEIKANGNVTVGGKALTSIHGTHVPMIVNWPAGGTKGKVCNDLIDTTDFLPTFLEAAAVKPPAKSMLDGRSFLPQIRGQSGQPRDWAFFHFIKSPDKPATEWILDQRWKLYTTGEFYDYRADPKEHKPVSGGGEANAARAKLQTVLDRMKAEGGGIDKGKSAKPEKKGQGP
ncbi:MAG: sulfatase-like hydrolase/transferase, partial [Planctomycetota bacterium]